MNITRQTTDEDLIEFEPLILENKLFKLCAEANKAETEWSKADEQFDILHDVHDDFFGELVLDEIKKYEAAHSHEDKFKPLSNVAAEHQVRQSLKWKEFMLGYQQARYKAKQAKVAKSVAERNWRTCQSILSSVRQTKVSGV